MGSISVESEWDSDKSGDKWPRRGPYRYGQFEAHCAPQLITQFYNLEGSPFLSNERPLTFWPFVLQMRRMRHDA
eukprot:9028497-Pyramimonas_sp.AAC.1